MFRRRLLLAAAKQYAIGKSKKLIHINCGDNPIGDVNADIIPRNAPNFCLIESGKPLPFSDGEFGALFSENTLECSPSPIALLQEFNRIADRVFIVIPMFWDISLLKTSSKWIPANLQGTKWIENPMAKLLVQKHGKEIEDEHNQSLPVPDIAQNNQTADSSRSLLLESITKAADFVKTKFTEFGQTLKAKNVPVDDVGQ